MTSIFTTMTQLARQHNAINLAQGFPNFEPDRRLVEITARLAKEDFHQYMPSSGYLPLLQKISATTKDFYARTIATDEILITAGATQGIFTAIQALIKSGEEVIILDPAYDSYDMPIRLIGANALHISLGDDFRPDWNAIRQEVSHKTRMIIINNPHNPSGKTWTEHDFEALEKLCEDFPQLLVLSDEVYEFISFNPHISVNSRPKLANKSIIVSSFGKSFHITGWKIGYLIAPEHLMAEIKKVHQFLVFSVNSVSQAALSEYLDVVNLDQLANFYQQKRDTFSNLLSDTGFELLPCEGTYFQVASYKNISDESDLDFVKRLTIEHGVAAIPLSVFNESGRDDKLIRFCFAKDDATLEQAAINLQF